MRYKCDKETSQVYGTTINNKYSFICKKCMFHKA